MGGCVTGRKSGDSRSSRMGRNVVVVGSVVEQADVSVLELVEAAEEDDNGAPAADVEAEDIRPTPLMSMVRRVNSRA